MSATRHNPKLSRCLILLAVLGLTAAPTPAAWFAKYDGIDGEAIDEDHKKWIDVLSVNQQAVPAGLDSVGLGEVTLTKRVDASSPALQQAAASGEAFGVIDLDFLEREPATGKPVVYLRYKLKDAIVSSYSLSSDGAGGAIETVTLGPPSAGNLVQDFFDDDSGRRTDRTVRSFLTDPVTGEMDFGFAPAKLRLRRGARLRARGTPDFDPLDDDSDGDGLSDGVGGVWLTGLSSSGADGFDATIRAHEMGHNLDLRHGDPNNVARVEAVASFDDGGSYSYGVERELKESGEKMTSAPFVDFEGIGSSAYDYVITNGDDVVAEGTASAFDTGIFITSESEPTEELTLSYEKIKWSYKKADRASTPLLEDLTLDPTLPTTVVLRAIDPLPSSGLLTNVSYGFGNFESVAASGFTAVPEPAAGVMVALGLASLIGGRRRR